MQCIVHRAVAVSLNLLLAECRKVVGHLKHSPTNQKESLAQEVPIRWNNTLEIIKRILRNVHPLESYASPPHTHCRHDNSCWARESEEARGCVGALQGGLIYCVDPCYPWCVLFYIIPGMWLIFWEETSLSLVQQALSALCHRSRVLKVTEDDPAYMVVPRLKKVSLCEIFKLRNDEVAHSCTGALRLWAALRLSGQPGHRWIYPVQSV